MAFPWDLSSAYTYRPSSQQEGQITRSLFLLESPRASSYLLLSHCLPFSSGAAEYLSGFNFGGVLFFGQGNARPLAVTEQEIYCPQDYNGTLFTCF